MAGSKTISRVSNMTRSHLQNIMQIMVFQLNDHNYYGINVSKIRSIEDYKRHELVKNNIDNLGNTKILEGYINYQGNIIPMLSVEKWLGIYTPENLYRETIVSEFNRRTICFPIFDVLNIYNVPIEALQHEGGTADGVLTYSTILEIDGEEKVVFVLDVEQLIDEVFGTDLTRQTSTEIASTKTILVAEDSRSARGIIEEMLMDTGLPYWIFNDGQQIIDYLAKLTPAQISDIGLVITDLEMPQKDGYQVISYIKQNPALKHLPVFVNSSMSNEGVKKKTEALGAVGFVEKTNPDAFLRKIHEHILR